MTQVNFDGSFAGFLCSVFEVYERRLEVVRLMRPANCESSLWESLNITTDTQKAKRVWSGLQRKLSNKGLQNIYKTFLSEIPGCDDNLLLFIKHAFTHNHSVEDDFAFEPALYVQQTARKVHREKHRMEAFVRFERFQDDLYVALVQPDYNVLPLIAPHFTNRYTTQHWLIYDAKRRYGIHHPADASSVDEVQVSWLTKDRPDAQYLHEEEVHYQQLWKEYFSHVNIKSRKNLKLHIQHVPVRYWKYLTEKQGLLA